MPFNGRQNNDFPYAQSNKHVTLCGKETADVIKGES